MSQCGQTIQVHVSSASLFNGVALKICMVELYHMVFFSLVYMYVVKHHVQQ